jgi:CHASE3 domain sensor protein
MSEKNGGSPGKPDVEALRAEIKQTRSELGETVQALAAKADVKARAKEQVEQTKQRVRAQAAEATGKGREAAVQATDRVRAAAGQAGDRVGQAADRASDAVAPAGEADVAVAGRRIPIALLVAGAAAVVGVILLVRGSRR